MKAFVVEQYGKNGLRAADVPEPEVGDGDVRISKISGLSRRMVAGELDTIEIGKAQLERNDSRFSFGDVEEGGAAGAAPGRRVAVALETEAEMVPHSGSSSTINIGRAFDIPVTGSSRSLRTID